MTPGKGEGKALALRWLPWVALCLLWWIDPAVESEYIDPADTKNYNDYFNYVGFRILIVTVGKLFGLFGFSPQYAAIALNCGFTLYLVLLLRRFSKSWTPAILFLSPAILLMKNVMSTDFYAGVVLTHALFRLEEVRQAVRRGESSPLGGLGLCAALVIVSLNLKSTAILGLGAYGVVFLLQERRVLRLYAPALRRLLCWLAVWWGVELAVYFAIYGDPFYRYIYEFHKSKGGNAPHEIAGARASVPVPLFFYHLYAHVKVVGRLGVAGVVALVSLWPLRKNSFAPLYAAALLLYSLLAVGGYLTMERYWGVMLPLQLVLATEALHALQSQSRYRWLVRTTWTAGVAVSLVNYIFRYYPLLYASAGYLLTGGAQR